MIDAKIKEKILDLTETLLDLKYECKIVCDKLFVKAITISFKTEIDMDSVEKMEKFLNDECVVIKEIIYRPEAYNVFAGTHRFDLDDMNEDKIEITREQADIYLNLNQ